MQLKCCFFLPEIKDKVTIIDLLNSYDIEVIPLSDNSEKGLINEILKLEPDLVLVDIDCCEIDILHHTLLQCFETIPYLVGVSQSKEQAYQCIKLGLTDYLLKGILELELRKSVRRIKKEIKAKQSSICFKNYSDYYFLNPDEILYLKADNNTTDILLTSGKILPAFKTLKTFEENLPKNFLRIHNSYIVNTQKILRINFGKSQVHLTQCDFSAKVPFSKSYREKLKNLKEMLAKQDIVF